MIIRITWAAREVKPGFMSNFIGHFPEILLLWFIISLVLSSSLVVSFLLLNPEVICIMAILCLRLSSNEGLGEWERRPEQEREERGRKWNRERAKSEELPLLCWKTSSTQPGGWFLPEEFGFSGFLFVCFYCRCYVVTMELLEDSTMREWTFGLFPSWKITNNAAINILVYVWWEQIFLFL